MPGQIDRKSRLSNRLAGFTLVELLTVIGVVLVFAGLTVGVFRGVTRSSTVGLEAGQASLVSLLNAARATALSSPNEGRVRLLVAADPGDPDRYLRHLLVVTESRSNSDTWESNGEGVFLPRGVYVVPENDISMTAGLTWTSVRSSFSGGPVSMTVDGINRNFFHVNFTRRGTTQNVRVVLGVAESSASGPLFQSDRAIRGVRLSNYGIPTLFDEPDVF